MTVKIPWGTRPQCPAAYGLDITKQMCLCITVSLKFSEYFKGASAQRNALCWNHLLGKEELQAI